MGGRGGGGGGGGELLEGRELSESIEKGKIVMKISFSDNVESSSEKLWKMISADVKINVKKRNERTMVTVSYKFLEEIPLQLEI